MAVVYLVGSLVLIFLAAELFTNAIEWFGKRLRLGDGAVGSVLAALGTALPETSIAIVAIMMGGAENIHAGVGAILGAPMMLSTLAMLLTGGAILFYAMRRKRHKHVNADYAVIGNNFRSFFLVYILALVAAEVTFRSGKLLIALFLLFIYGRYVYVTIKCRDCDDSQEMRPLHFHRKADIPKLRFVCIQLTAALALMVFAAEAFVHNVVVIARALHVSSTVLSVLITPIATELPEIFNSVTWVRHKKDTLALGNVTGAMVFQSSVPPAIGILFTNWRLDVDALTAIGVALLASFAIWLDITLRKRLSAYSMMGVGMLYLLFPLAIFVVHHAGTIHLMHHTIRLH